MRKISLKPQNRVYDIGDDEYNTSKYHEDRVRAFKRQLSPQQLKLIALIFDQQLSLRAAARKLNISVSSAETQWRRINEKALRKMQD